MAKESPAAGSAPPLAVAPAANVALALPRVPLRRRIARALSYLVLVAVVLVGLPLWPILVVSCVVPPLAMLSFPVLLLDTLLVAYSIAWLTYLLLAPSDAAPFAHSSNHKLLLPYDPLQVARTNRLALRYVSQMFRLVVPAIFDWPYRRVMILGTQTATNVIRENVEYAPNKLLDIYLPPILSRTHETVEPIAAQPNANAPMILILPSLIPPLSVTKNRRTYMQLALRFRRQGYAVVVPDIAYYPSCRVRSSVSDVRTVLAWIGTQAQTFGADPERIYVLGHGFSAHLALLTASQHAVVHSREKFLEASWEQQQQATGHEPSPLTKEEAVASPSHGSLAPHMSPSHEASDNEDDEEQDLTITNPGLQAKIDSVWAKTEAALTSSGPDTPRQPTNKVSDLERTCSALGHRHRHRHRESYPSSPAQTSPCPNDHSSKPLFPPVQPQWPRTAIPSSLAEAEDTMATMGLHDVELYAPEEAVPPVRGLILLGGVSDVVKAWRWERELNIEQLSWLRRSLGPSHTSCLLHSPAHLLTAARNILDAQLFPPKLLLIHGGQDTVVRMEQSTLLRDLLKDVGVEQVRMRAYRTLGHVDLLASVFLGMRRSLARLGDSVWTDMVSFDSDLKLDTRA